MADQHRPEVNLEINSGYFRIPTKEMIYNITVIAEHGGIPIVEKIVEVEKRVEAAGSAASADPYFRQISQETLANLADLGRGFAQLTEVIEGRTEHGAGSEKIMAARTALAGLKDVAVSPGNPAVVEAGPSQQFGADFAELVAKLQQVKAKVGSTGSSSSNSAPEVAEEPKPPAAPTAKRYLFDLDVIFQTLYELCTNEAVKSHIVKARENRETYFDKPLFLDKMNEKVAGLEADSDNFFNMPMTDVLTSLQETCNEKPIQNLLIKMDSNQATIFLDSILPLEVPAVEEGEAAPEVEESPQDTGVDSVDENNSADNGQLEEAGALLDEALQLVDAMAGKVAGEGGAEGAMAGSGTNGEELADRIDQVDTLLENTLTNDNDEGGGQDMQEVTAFRQRLLEAVLTLHEEIRLKKENESLAVDGVRQQAASTAAGKAAEVKNQQDMEKLLTELGL